MKENKKKILVVDDEEDLAVALCQILKNENYEVFLARNGEEAIAKAQEVLPDLVLLDMMLPFLNGKEVKQYFNEDKFLRETPVIFVTAKDRVEDKVEGLHLAEDYVTKPFEIKELLARVEAVLNRKRRYEEASMMDDLTGLGNSRVFEKQLEVVFNIAKRYRRPFSIAMMDLDRLKQINDAFGHQIGTAAIKVVADTMKEVFRYSDILIHYGGDEFVVLFPECEKKQALEAVERFQQKLATKKITADSQQIPVSVSVGVAAYTEGLKTASELFQQADDLMYQAKKIKKVER